ncbi:MAG: HAD-IIIA family hydrolase [Verrucomicrobiota bacterium]
MKQMVILAGGEGTRIKDRLGELPKPMIRIGDKPLLEHQIELARHYGFSDILILAGYRAEAITSYFEGGARWGVSITYEIERAPLGTAGAVLAAFPRLADEFVVMYGDEMVNVDLERFVSIHERTGADATLFLHPNDHPLDSDLVEVNDEGWITAFHNRPHSAERFFQNLVNAALYVVRKRALLPWSTDVRPMDFGRDLFPAMLSRGCRLLGYQSPEYIKDIGTPQRYDRVCAEYFSGVVQRSSLSTAQPAVFLDRDGTLNKEVNGLISPAQLELLPGVADAIQHLNHSGIRAIVITNQPVVAKGFCAEIDIRAVHNKLETLLGKDHAFLDRIYYCPHHPERGFAGERAELKIECACRKPKPGLVVQAVHDLNLDLSASWLVGDSTTDIETARNAGLKSILVRTGYAGGDGKYSAKPDFVFDNLNQAVHFILEQQHAKA